MLLEQVIDRVKSFEAASPKDITKPIKKLGNLTGEELIELLNVMALTRVAEEYTTCLMSPMDSSVPGSRYHEDFIQHAKFLFEYERNEEGREIIDFLSENKPHVPFFINSAGTELVSSVSTKFSTEYYKRSGRTSSQDKDMFFDYYRMDTGIAIGLWHYSLIKNNINALDEINKVSLGSKDARSVLMCEHMGFPELGKPTPTSMIAGNVGEALNHAIAQSRLRKLDDEYMANAPDSVTKLFIGDGGTSETVVKTVSDNLKLELYQLWRDAAYPSPEDIKKVMGNRELKRDAYQELLYVHPAPIKLEINVLDNGVAISRTSQATHPFGDPLDSFDELVDLGIAQRYECDGTSLEDVLKTEVKKQEAIRDYGIVITRYTVPRPAGHSASNFSGFGEIPKGKETKALTLNESEVKYHQNTDPLLNSIETLMEQGVVDGKTAVSLIHHAQKKMIKSVYNVLKEHEPKTKEDLHQIMAWSPEKVEENWKKFTSPEQLEGRNSYWKGNHNRMGYSTLISKTHPIKMDLGEEGIPDGKMVSPIQAENYSLIDLAMLNDGRFRGIGQDISDIDPARIQEVMDNINLGLGGINRQTAKVQAFLHVMNPETGAHHIVDNGIDEIGQWAAAAGYKHAFKDNALVFLEIQFNNYNLYGMELEQIASLYQRSNGRENIPLIIRQSSGFFRATSVNQMWGKEEGLGKDGAGGVYHTSLNWDVNCFPGISVVCPNNSLQIQDAYQNAFFSQTPTVIFTHESSMKSFPIKFKNDSKEYYQWSHPYRPLSQQPNPMGSHYQHPVKIENNPLPLIGHNHLILTHSEYASLSNLIANKLFENSKGAIKPLVVDYCWLNPRDKELPHKLFEEFVQEGKDIPYTTIISQQSEFGFGNVIRGDVNNALQDLGQSEQGKHLQFFYSSLRLGAYHENHLKNPDLSEIYSIIKQQHRGVPVKPYKAPGEMKGVHNPVVL